MLYLLTGSPGSGKTLSAIDWIVRVKRENPERLIYAANINGLNIPGVIELDHDQVRQWHEVCEKGSIIFVDEAQRYWRAQRSGEVPPSVIEMETHRHDGIDIVMMTQHPTFLHANIRKLVNQHVHLCAYTKHSALRWEWREAHDDVQDNALRAGGEFQEWHYPQECYGLYKSAEVHTKIAKRPLRQVLGRIALGFAAFVFLLGVGYVVYAIRDYQHKHALAVEGAPASSPASVPGVQLPGKRSAVPDDPRAYVATMIPRVESMPWSAPIYDAQQVTQHPHVYCMSLDEPGRCTCITEQGTKYPVSEPVCRDIALNGPPYDPFLPERRQDAAPASAAAGPAAGGDQAASQPVAVPVGIPGAPRTDRVAATAKPYVPPTYGPLNPDEPLHLQH